MVSAIDEGGSGVLCVSEAEVKRLLFIGKRSHSERTSLLNATSCLEEAPHIKNTLGAHKC